MFVFFLFFILDGSFVCCIFDGFCNISFLCCSYDCVFDIDIVFCCSDSCWSSNRFLGFSYYVFDIIFGGKSSFKCVSNVWVVWDIKICGFYLNINRYYFFCVGFCLVGDDWFLDIEIYVFIWVSRGFNYWR